MRPLTTFLLGAVFLLLCAVTFADSAKPPPEVIEVTVRMTKERYNTCIKEGGCAFLTPAEVQWSWEKGKEEGVKEWEDENLDFHGCRKDAT